MSGWTKKLSKLNLVKYKKNYLLNVKIFFEYKIRDNIINIESPNIRQYPASRVILFPFLVVTHTFENSKMFLGVWESTSGALKITHIFSFLNFIPIFGKNKVQRYISVLYLGVFRDAFQKYPLNSFMSLLLVQII